MTRKRASASGRVGIDLAAVPAWDDVPPEGRSTGAGIGAGIVLIKGLDYVKAKRGDRSRLEQCGGEDLFQLAYQRELCTAPDPELHIAGVLTYRAAELIGHFNVPEHQVIDLECKRLGLFGSEFFEFIQNIIRKVLRCVFQKSSHHFCHLAGIRDAGCFYGFYYFRHAVLLYLNGQATCNR